MALAIIYFDGREARHVEKIRRTIVLRVLGLGLLLSAAALAETWNGAIIDVMCRPEHIAAGVKKCPNVRQCMLSPLCQSSGYGVILEGGKFLKFDAAGSAK